MIHSVMGVRSSNLRLKSDGKVDVDVPVEKKSDERPEMLLQKTAVIMNEFVTSSHCDANGKIKCGQLLKWMDIAACLRYAVCVCECARGTFVAISHATFLLLLLSSPSSAERCASSTCVTAKVDDLYFSSPVASGMVVIIHAVVNCAWNTSCEIGVKVTAEDMLTGDIVHCCSAFFVFVTQRHKKTGAKVLFPVTIPITDVEKANFTLANERRMMRRNMNSTLEKSASAVMATEAPLVAIAAGETNEEVKVVVKDALDSSLCVTKLVLPNNANHMGNTFGGEIMEVSCVTGLSLQLFLV